MRMVNGQTSPKREFGIIFTFVLITSLLLTLAINQSSKSGDLGIESPYIVSTKSSGVISDRNLLLTVASTLETNCECVILNASVNFRFGNSSNRIYVDSIDNPEISDGTNTVKFYFRSEITRFELREYIITMEWEVLETDNEFYPGDMMLAELTIRIQDIRIENT